MASVQVKVLYNKRHIKTIERPLHGSGNAAYVVYKGKAYPLHSGNFIELEPATGNTISTDSEDPAAQADYAASDQESGMEWDLEQKQVIQADASARMLVDAGPGTGKTAVACARVAWLIDHAGVEPTAIWLVSFTRTAVHEIRKRIGSCLSDPGKAAGIRIATIDSHSWAIQSGFCQDASLAGDYETSIRKVTDLIRENDGVFEYLFQVRHLFIDEAQDVVGPRVELLLEMIHALPQEAGVTVLCDEAQAIYGFAEDDSPDTVGGTLPDNIREFMSDEFVEVELSNVHRTKDTVLGQVFADGRKLIRKQRTSPPTKYADIRALVEKCNHGLLGQHRKDLQDLPAEIADSFLLFRRRGEALEASSYLGLRPHRLRMSGLPANVHEWIGRMFWDWTDAEMTRTVFEERWAQRSISTDDLLSESAWSDLVRIAGISLTRISLRKLATRLGCNSPPIDFCLPDFGFAGPLIGTIHGAKGREADQVRLYLPPDIASLGYVDDDQLLQEARILFVGASRARKELLVGSGATQAIARRLESSGRAYTPFPFRKTVKEARAMVEIGRINDLDACGLTGKVFFATPTDALHAQQAIMACSGKMVSLGASLQGKMGWSYAVFADEAGSTPFAVLNQQVNRDMFDIAKKVNEIVRLGKWKAPEHIPYLRSFGIRTLALAPDDPVREMLHSPWRDSGFLLAPSLCGYGMVYFRK